MQSMLGEITPISATAQEASELEQVPRGKGHQGTDAPGDFAMAES